MFGFRPHDSGLDQPMMSAIGFNDAVPGALGSTIDTEDTHARSKDPAYARASISFSSISAFEKTF